MDGRLKKEALPTNFSFDSMDLESEIPTGVYRHFKGNFYYVVGTAKHSETEALHVIYYPIQQQTSDQSNSTKDSKSTLWIRPLAMFTEQIQHNGAAQPRFQQIEGFPQE